MTYLGPFRSLSGPLGQVIAAGEKQLSPEEYDELVGLVNQYLLHGLTAWINVRLKQLINKIDWQLEIPESPEYSEALQVCDYNFLGNELKAMCVNAGLSPSGDKKELCARLYKAGVEPVVVVMQPIIDRVKAEKKGKVPVSDYGIFRIPMWPEVNGVFVGGCVERGIGSSFRAKAHAHNRPKMSYYGWICVRSIKRIGEHKENIITKPSQLMWHEYAHLLTPNHSHDDAWRKKMKELGQPIPKQYEKKPRR